jgi:hypothetical protein
MKSQNLALDGEGRTLRPTATRWVMARVDGGKTRAILHRLRQGRASMKSSETAYGRFARRVTLILRRLVLIALCLAAPPLLAYALYAGGQYYLAASHKVLDQQTQTYAFYGELAIFYIGSLLELRSRWSPAE